MKQPEINQTELIKILARYSDDTALGFEELKLFIKQTSVEYAETIFKTLIPNKP